MWEELQRVGYLYQREVARKIARKYGARWLYRNENGNPAIDINVLARFREHYAGTARWNRYALRWELLDDG